MRRFRFGRHVSRELVILVGIGVVALVMVSGVGLPQLGRFLDLRRDTQRRQRDLQDLRALAQRLPFDVSQAHAEERFPQQFLETLERWAGAEQLHLSLKPQPVQQDGAMRRLVVELTVEATQEGVARFLDRLLTDPSVVVIDRCRLLPSGVKEAPMRAMLSVTKWVVQPG